MEEEVLSDLGSSLGESTYVYAPDYVDLQKVINLLKAPIIKTSYRLYVLNQDETINREIPEEDIIVSECSYSENYENGQRRNVNIALNNSDGKYTPSVNNMWINTRFRLDIGVSSTYYTDTYWFPRGIYVLGNPVAERGSSDKKLSLNLLDKFAYLEGPVGTLEATYEIPVDTDIKSAIGGILGLDNGMGYPVDCQPFVYDASFEGQTMPYTLSKDAGSTLGDMILDIAHILNAECFYNNMGNLTFIPINVTSNDTDKPVLWDYSEDEAELFNLSMTYDFENTINSVHVVGDNINNALFYASAENTNALSPICIQRVGRRILYINDTNIFSNKLAKDRARYELRIRGILGTSSTINVSFNPLLFVDNLITITDSFFDFKREKFLIQSISYNFGTGNQMTLSCSNLTNFTPDPYGDLEYTTCDSEAQAVALILNWFGGAVPEGFYLSFDEESEDYYAYDLRDENTTYSMYYFQVFKADCSIYAEEHYVPHWNNGGNNGNDDDWDDDDIIDGTEEHPLG